MSSSDEDAPLVTRKVNGVQSRNRIRRSLDKPLARQASSSAEMVAGMSIQNGPVEEMGGDKPATNGVANGKRKSRSSLTNGRSYKEASSSDGDDKPLNKRRKTSKAVQDSDSEEADIPLAHKIIRDIRHPFPSASQISESSDSDVPLNTKLAIEKRKAQKAGGKTAKAVRAGEKKAAASKNSKKRHKVAGSDSEDDVPLSKKTKPASMREVPNGVKKEESDDGAPLSRKSASSKKGKVKAEAISTPEKGKARKAVQNDVQSEDNLEGEAQGDGYRWWEDPTKGDGTKKWDMLEHNGVVFPPPYEPLPSSVKLIYDGKPVTLHVEAEEIATFYGSMLNSAVNVENPTFNKNFFTDFKEVLDKTGHGKDKNGKTVEIKAFEKCDFKPIFDFFEAQRLEKKALPAAEKKRLKAEKEEAEAPYMFCYWNGRRQKVGNYRVEPPALFRGRGEHPKTGKVKKRVLPEQITINIGKGAKVPTPPPGHKWKEVKHDQEGTWLAMWQENINGAYKYVMLAANSDIKGQSDFRKFEKARELKQHIDRIRSDYTRELKSKIMADRQLATAVYLIDRFALRAGNEKGEDEADTVGCCSLKFENVNLIPPKTVVFDFLGKDSIRFYDEVEVDPQVFKNLKIFKKSPKKDGDEIFDRLTTSQLNKHLSSYMPGLTAKVFRTYNASWTMANLLKKMKAGGTIHEKIKEYNDANREVAILCNHKRTVAAGHAVQMEKLQDKINGMRFQQWRLKQMMIDVKPRIKKERGADYFARPEGLDDEWIMQHIAALGEESRQKIRKKFEKENEKRLADGEKPMRDGELKERLEAADELEAKYKKEHKSGKVEAEGKGPTVEKFEAQVDKLSQRIEAMRLQAQDRDNNKEVALGTSKINYIDPRLTAVFSKKFNVPIEKLFSKTLREKFEWAIKSVDEDWEF